MVAGPHSKGLLETSEADWDVIFDVGLRGTFLGCQRAVRRCSRRSRAATCAGA